MKWENFRNCHETFDCFSFFFSGLISIFLQNKRRRKKNGGFNWIWLDIITLCVCCSVWAHFLVPTVCVVCTPFHHLSCVYIYTCVCTALCFQFSLPTLSSSSVILGYFQPERRGAIAAWSPAVRTVKCVEGVTRDRRRQGSANVESNDGALSILFLFQESKKKKKRKKFGRPAVRLIRSNFKKKKEKRPDRIVGAFQCDWTLRWWYHSYSRVEQQ